LASIVSVQWFHDVQTNALLQLLSFTVLVLLGISITLYSPPFITAEWNAVTFVILSAKLLLSIAMMFLLALEDFDTGASMAAQYIAFVVAGIVLELCWNCARGDGILLYIHLFIKSTLLVKEWCHRQPFTQIPMQSPYPTNKPQYRF
jgi:uncharacterized membrane protein